MFSKSLDPTQQRWTVWEGEMYALREGLYHFRGIVGGCFIVLGPEHLNDLLVNSSVELRQPAKVLRWLQEIEQVGVITWRFTLGTSNLFADMASRRPPLRDVVKKKLVEKVNLPKTLQEAIQQVVGWFGIGGSDGAQIASGED